MLTSLTEDQAWAVVRAAPVGGGDVPVPHPGAPGTDVVVCADGTWRTDAFVTDAARRVLDLHLPLRRSPAWVLGQMGQSLDGRIATETGHSHYVTGPEDIRRLHRLRALADAVVVGAGTAASDDPRLTVREVPGEDPVRVVLDPSGRLEPGLRLFTDGAAPTLVVRRAGQDGSVPAGAEALPVDDDGTGRVPPRALLAALRARGLARILVEGGGLTVSGFLQDGALDRLHVTVAPLVLGSGRAAFTLEPVERLDEGLRPRCRIFPLGGDVLFELDLRTPAGAASGEADEDQAPG